MNKCVISELMKNVRIKFWGVRGSVAVPGKSSLKFGGNTSCVEIAAGDTLIICDAGTGIRPLGDDLMRRYGKKPIKATILLSHVHWDHYIGLPFFKPLYLSRNHFDVGGPKPEHMNFGQAIRGVMRPPYFPIPVSAIPSRLSLRNVAEKKFRIGDVNVLPLGVNHPGGAFGWRFDFPSGKSLVHVTDNEPKDDATNDSIVRWAQGADVMIHDAQYTPKNYEKRIGWGHSPYSYPVKLAQLAKVKRLFLFHFDPDASDEELSHTLQCARGMAVEGNSKLKCEMAKEGLEVLL